MGISGDGVDEKVIEMIAWSEPDGVLEALHLTSVRVRCLLVKARSITLSLLNGLGEKRVIVSGLFMRVYSVLSAASKYGSAVLYSLWLIVLEGWARE